MYQQTQTSAGRVKYLTVFYIDKRCCIPAASSKLTKMDMSTISTDVSLNQKLKVMDTLTCNNCEYYLNIPPLMSFRDGTTICGRCYDATKYENVPSNERPTQNVPLESVVQLFPFACIYRTQGCTLRNISKNYLIHESNCRFRPFVCPVGGCTWAGLMREFKAHFETDHESNFLTTSVIPMNTSNDYIEYYMISNENQEILLQCKYNASSNKYFCDCVALLNSSIRGDYIMQLEFKTDDDTVIVFKKQISNRSEAIDESKALQIDVGSLKTLLNTDCPKPNVKVFSVGNENKRCDSKLLNELKCPVCLMLMRAPVFLCPNGHSVCGGCKDQLNTCPICRVSYGNPVHNFTLQKVIGEIMYPCKNQISGCGFIALSPQTAEHERNCEYAIL